MKIKNLYIREFRAFKDTLYPLGQRITVIAGHNATGKSTILAVLGHCGELKKYRPLIKRNFRADLGDIIKFSREHDVNISEATTVCFYEQGKGVSKDYPEEISFRTRWDEDPIRYRFIPKKTKKRNSYAKATWPTLYLGLSRLYPIGESAIVSEGKIDKSLTQEDLMGLYSDYLHILSLEGAPAHVPSGIGNVRLSEGINKNAFGMITPVYDHWANSAGQDNLSQILLGVLSFKKLKETLQDDWEGGLLLIDELDATLHPSAQIRLVEHLDRNAKDLGIQIVFTTHSLTLLERVSDKVHSNTDDQPNEWELIYLTTANGSLQYLPNPQYETIYYDMQNILGESALFRKVPIYFEDDEARFFFKKLVHDYLSRVKIVETSLGCDQLLKLASEDFSYFSSALLVLDGDVENQKITELSRIVCAEVRNIIKLPTDKSPEELIWAYLDEMDKNHPFLIGGQGVGRSKRNIHDCGPYSNKYAHKTKVREKFKDWFRDNRSLIDDLFDFWIKDNPEAVDAFREEYIRAYNFVAVKMHLPKLKYRSYYN